MSKKRKEHHEEHADETWLIPYSDLLTLLLALFIILFASSQVDSQKYEQLMASLNSAFTGGTGFFELTRNVPPVNPGQPQDEGQKSETNPNDAEQTREQQLQKEQNELEALREKLEGYIKDNGLTTQLETKLTEDMLMITIRDHALFASGSATVKTEARELGRVIAAMLAQYPGYEIEVAGHTDNVPILNSEYRSNWDLSGERAVNFMKVLIDNSNVDAARFRYTGYGEFQPIDSNSTEAGRARNRRVEVNILRSIGQAEVRDAGQAQQP